MQTINRLSGALIKIGQLKINANLKSKIIFSGFKVFSIGLYDSENKIANIAGFKAKFLDFKLFKYLFHEIFLGKDYYFISDSKTPYIIDCGSNIGMSVLYFKMIYPNAEIVAFEPGEETYQCLNDNIKNNSLNSVTVHKVALSDKEGTIEFFYDEDDVGSLVMSVIQERMTKQSRSVKAVLLSNYIDRDVDFLKMDIEGAELSVIKELSETNKLRYIKEMMIEYHHHIASDIDEFSKMLKLLEDAGFGYQIECSFDGVFTKNKFQDIMIYAYLK